MRGADAVVEMLIRHGVKHIFGVPGDTSMAFHDALRLRQNEICHVICRDERDAAYTADAYARVTGKLGVVEVPSGGGALYVVPGLSEANVSNIPLLCIASEINMSSEETNALTDCNQEQLLAAVTKWNNKLKNTSLIPHMMRKAVRKSLTGTPGVTALSFPENVLRDEYKGSSENLYATCGIERKDSFRSAPTATDVEAFLGLLNEAEKPVVIAGGGVHLSYAYQELNEFVEKYATPLVSSLDGKGGISEYSPYSLGTIGSNGGSTEANETTAHADLLIVLGCKMDNVTTMGKKVIPPNAKIIQVDISDDVLSNNLLADLPIMADIKEVLKAVNEQYDGTMDYAARHAEWCAYAKEQVEAKFARVKAEQQRQSSKVTAARLFSALEQQTDENTIFVGDAGTPTPYVASYVRIKKAGRKSILPRGHGALGFAIGAALGVSIGQPDATVVATFGDASFGMAMCEIETIKRLGRPIVLVNLQNDCYGWIKTIQRLYYNENYFGVDFSPIDAVKIAEGFGIAARHVYNNDEVDEAVAWALAQKAPVLLNCLIEPITDFVPPVAQWEIDAGKPADQREKLVY